MTDIQLTDQPLVEQIGQLADRTRQTPEEVVTRAIELYIRQFPAENPPDKEQEYPSCEAETGGMSLEEIMDTAKSVLRELADNAASIMAESEPVRRSGLLEVMNRLSRRIDKAENAEDLVAAANIVYDLTAEIPMFPPDDEPRRQYFRMKSVHDDNGYQRIRNQKAALQEVFYPSFERIEQAWRNTPSVIPPNASLGSKETPWDIMGIFKDDPTWGEIFDEIERDRDKDSVWLGGESE
jgi:hypothetical protein